MDDKQFLQKAIMKARESVAQGGFPVGAIVVSAMFRKFLNFFVNLLRLKFGKSPRSRANFAEASCASSLIKSINF